MTLERMRRAGRLEPPPPPSSKRCTACGRWLPMAGMTCVCQARLLPLVAGHLAPLVREVVLTDSRTGQVVLRGPGAVLAWRDQHRDARRQQQLADARRRPAGMDLTTHLCLQEDLGAGS